MSKSLTEKWYDGKLEFGAYYVNYQYNIRVWLYRERSDTPQKHPGVFEILQKVPSYDEYNELLDYKFKYGRLQ